MTRREPIKAQCDGCARWTPNPYRFQHEQEPEPYVVCGPCHARLLAEQIVRVNGEGDDRLSHEASHYTPEA
jgi:hypothetical protein